MGTGVNNTIHIHQENNFDRSRLIILMIPCLVFLVVLAIYLSLIPYKSPSQTAATTSGSNVLGTNK